MIVVGAMLVLVGVVYGPVALLLSGAAAVLFRTVLSGVELLVDRPVSAGVRDGDRC